MSETRIPQAIVEFDLYIRNTDTLLQAIYTGTTHNWERLGVDSGDATEWHDRRLLWENTLYPKYSNPLTKTKGATDDVHDFMDSFRVFANPIIEAIAANKAATNDDANVFH